MAAILRQTISAAALLQRPPCGAGRLARFLGAGASAASHDAGATPCAAADFVPWRNGGGVLHRAATVDPTAVVEAGAVVRSGAVIGKEVVIGSGTVVGPSVSVGQSTRIGYNVVLSNCSVGKSCSIHNGACIGQDGFSFFVDEDGQVKKKPQGMVTDAVYVSIADVSLTGFGFFVDEDGQVKKKPQVRLAANSLVTKDIQNPGDYGGFPAVPINEWRRQTVNVRLFSKKHGDKR